MCTQVHTAVVHLSIHIHDLTMFCHTDPYSATPISYVAQHFSDVGETRPNRHSSSRDAYRTRTLTAVLEDLISPCSALLLLLLPLFPRLLQLLLRVLVSLLPTAAAELQLLLLLFLYFLLPLLLLLLPHQRSEAFTFFVFFFFSPLPLP